ncbi:chaperonin 10-like protein [Massariosphaeria phaeospora]|uniref:D-xylulose reductase n=1 Tax=Massariosphaeria phaeospora TaxID=100035 RepID=A0A7C8I5Q9_9PLEO|nr:chaperonin 10-like protein [Massariosphaeria phaeospora]
MQNPSQVLYAAGSLVLEDKPIPTLSPRDVLVRIAYVGVCGSDVHFWRHGGIGAKVDPTRGLVMGHEATGTIHSIGPDVSLVSLGDRVAIEPGVPCRHCTPCKAGTYNLCKAMRFAAAPGPPGSDGSLDVHGTLCKYFRVAEDFVYRIPDAVSLQEAVLVEPVSVAVHAVKLVDVRPGETVVVMGSGTIGLLCGAVARVFGAQRVVLVDVLERKLEFARGWLGCETWMPDLSATPEVNAEKMLETLGVDGVDAVIEASGAASSVETGIHVLRPGGKYVQTGMGKRKIEFPIATMSEKELMVRGCFRYGAGDYELAVSLLTKKLIDVKPLINSVSAFEDTVAAWEKTARGDGIKNLIRGVEE